MGKTMRRQRFMALIILLILAIASASSAYPFIISESPINHTQAKQLVYSIPETYYEYIDVVEFKNKPTNKYWGYATAKWDKYHNCYEGKIWIYWDLPVRDKLLHEIGHIWELCYERKDNTTEDYANNFIIEK